MDKFTILNFNKAESAIYLPNEIFLDLSENIKTGSHRAFAYSYYYMVSYLYRQCKYATTQVFTQSFIKEYLGYNAGYKAVDYIIKQGGVLDEMGYTETTNDYPVSYTLDAHNDPHFTTISETGQKQKLSNTKIKVPVRAFHRNDLSKGKFFDGTFYDISYTHGTKPEVFIRMMQDPELLSMGFYIYSYIKCHAHQYAQKMLAQSQEDLAKNLKVSRSTLLKYLEMLEGKYIDIQHVDFSNNPKKFANVYTILQ